MPASRAVGTSGRRLLRSSVAMNSTRAVPASSFTYRYPYEPEDSEALAVTPDGRHLAIGTWPGFFELWDIDTGRLLETVKGPAGIVTALDISADGRLLALSSRDGSTRLWDITTRQWLATVATRRAGAVNPNMATPCS